MTSWMRFGSPFEISMHFTWDRPSHLASVHCHARETSQSNGHIVYYDQFTTSLLHVKRTTPPGRLVCFRIIQYHQS